MVDLKDLPRPVRANFILNVETDELFITAGLQDRVVQVRTRTLFRSERCSGQNHGASAETLRCAQKQEVRVVLSLQVYEGLVYMDFSQKIMEEQGYGTEGEADSDLTRWFEV